MGKNTPTKLRIVLGSIHEWCKFDSHCYISFGEDISRKVFKNRYTKFIFFLLHLVSLLLQVLLSRPVSCRSKTLYICLKLYWNTFTHWSQQIFCVLRCFLAEILFFCPLFTYSNAKKFFIHKYIIIPFSFISFIHKYIIFSAHFSFISLS